MRLGAIGDVIMTTPILKAIKQKYPDSKITYVVGHYASKVLVNNPYIDKLKIVDEELFYKKNIKGILDLVSQLKKEKYDYSFTLDKSWLFNLFSFLIGAKKRYGFSREFHLFNRILNTRTMKFTGNQKEYKCYSDILYTAFGIYEYGQMELFPTKQEKENVKTIVKTGKYVGIAPGGAINPGQSALQKRWPLRHYSQLIDHLIKNGKQVLIIGGPEDEEFSSKFKKATNVINKFNLRESYYLIKNYCNTFITHDSGPMHLAAAADVPKLITLFGPTPHKRFAPKDAIVITSPNCSPSYNLDGTFNNKDFCMKHIHVSQVIKHIK